MSKPNPSIEPVEHADVDRHHGAAAYLEPVNGTPPHPTPPDPYADADGPTGPADPKAVAAAAAWADGTYPEPGPEGPEPTAYTIKPMPEAAFFEGALARRLWLAYESALRDVSYRTAELRFTGPTPARWLLVARSVIRAHDITLDDNFRDIFGE